MTPADSALRATIERRGPVGFDVLMETALYDPAGGFYASGGSAGRGGDFITSPEVGPLFGAVGRGSRPRRAALALSVIVTIAFGVSNLATRFGDLASFLPA